MNSVIVTGNALPLLIFTNGIEVAVPSALLPANTALPAIGGPLPQGSTLTTTNGTWTGSPTSFSYQWKRGATNVGTNANTYVTVAGDVGSNISCTVTATNAGGSTSATAAAVGPIAAPATPTTQAFAWSNAAFAKIGDFTLSAGAPNYYATPTNGDGFIEFFAVGSQCEVNLYGDGTKNYYVTIDGGSKTLMTPPAGGFQWVTAYSGLSDAQHRVRVAGPFFNSDTTARVTGAAPAVSLPSEFASGSYNRFDLTPYTTYGINEAYSSAVNNSALVNGLQYVYNNPNGFGHRFRAATTSVRLWCYNGTTVSSIALYRNGVLISNTQPSGTGTGYELITLATGLSATAAEYEIVPTSKGYPQYDHAIFIDAFDTVPPTARQLDIFYGDSICALQGLGNSGDVRNGDAYKVAVNKGNYSFLQGNPSQSVYTYLRDNTAQVTAPPCGGTPARVFCCGGTNDMGNAVSTANFQAAYSTMLSSIRTGLPTAKIYARGILPRVGYSDATVLSYNNAMSAAVTALADANIFYMPSSGWGVDPTSGVDTVDGTHPNASGYAKIAAGMIAFGI